MRLKTTLIGLGALALVAAGCGSESLDGDDGGGDDPAASAPADSTDAATGSEDATGGSTEAATGSEDATGGSTEVAGGCEAGDSSLDGASIIIGSKDFDEQLILGNISKLLLEDAGVAVDDQINLGGTNPNREALLAGEIGHYWEYTGTAWISFFEEPDPIPDSQEQYEAVRTRDAEENDLCWLQPAPFNNTYGIAYRSEAAGDLGSPETLADLAPILEDNPDLATFCFESEFPARNDGLIAMEETYDLEVPEDNQNVLDTGVVYESTDRGDPCNFGEVFTTDGRIAALELTVLKDPDNAFPIYNVAPVFTAEVYSEYGTALEELYNPVAEALTEEVMTGLNAQVSAENQRPEAVAQTFLQDNGFLGG